MAEQAQTRRDDIFAEVWKEKWTAELNENVQLRGQIKAHEETLRAQSEQLVGYQTALEDLAGQKEALEREVKELRSAANVISAIAQTKEADDDVIDLRPVYNDSEVAVHFEGEYERPPLEQFDLKQE